MDINFFYELVGQYGLYAIFFLSMVEGDITLLLGGVLAHSAFFGEYSFFKVVCAGTLGGVTSDTVAFTLGRGFGTSVRDCKFYRMANPRIEKLTDKFGPLSIFLSKYVYGLRTACCVFYGLGRMPFTKFLLLSFGSCFLWVFILCGAGYFFSGAIINLLGDFHQLGIYLLIIVVIGITAFYLAERYWISKKVEEADPERIQEFEHAAQEKLHEISHEIQERIHLPSNRKKKKVKKLRVENED
jgi:membrane protein DedA with SNARE-associated domain